MYTLSQCYKVFKQRTSQKKNLYLLHHEYYVMHFDGCQCTEITVKEKTMWINTNWHYKFKIV